MLIDVHGVVSFHYEAMVCLFKTGKDSMTLRIIKDEQQNSHDLTFSLQDGVLIQHKINTVVNDYKEEHNGEEPPSYHSIRPTKKKWSFHPHVFNSPGVRSQVECEHAFNAMSGSAPSLSEVTGNGEPVEYILKPLGFLDASGASDALQEKTGEVDNQEMEKQND